MNCPACDTPIPKDKVRCRYCGKWCLGTSASGRRKKLGETSVDSVERLAPDSIGALACNGGFPRKTVTMIGGEPGTGKSTLVMQIAAHFGSTLYLAAEESADEIRGRAERLRLPGLLETIHVVECIGGNIWIDTALEGPPCELVVLDSIPGFVGRGNDAAAQAVLKELKKHVVENRSVAIAVDHATKSDFFAGALTLQHDVDITVVFTCTSASGRVLTSIKNRHGPSGKEEHMMLTEEGHVPDVEAQQSADDAMRGPRARNPAEPRGKRGS